MGRGEAQCELSQRAASSQLIDILVGRGCQSAERLASRGLVGAAEPREVERARHINCPLLVTNGLEGAAELDEAASLFGCVL